MTVRLTELALADLRDARDHYRTVSTDLEQRFIDHLDVVIDRLLAFPDGAPLVRGFSGVRRARMHRFPYGVFYHLQGDDVVVLRVLHFRRDVTDID